MPMDILLSGAPFLISALLAGIMGFAIQRGATCMVAAVDEMVSERRCRRLLALLGASVWVLGGLLIAQALGHLPRMPAGYAVTGYTFAGGALLGLGAFIGRACVFGAIARFGNGEWAYLLVPAGFFAGCATVAPLFMPATPMHLQRGSPVFDAAAWAGVGSGVLALVAVVRTWRSRPSVRVWSPGVATTVIGIAFLLMMLLVGPWSYTEALADVAQRMPHDLAPRALLMVALFAGAFVGGRTARRFASVPITLSLAARCFASGVLMGWGSLLIPGGNDGLILVGMPLLFPHAWVAMASMAAAIGAAMLISRRMAGGPDHAALAVTAGTPPSAPECLPSPTNRPFRG